ncbi:unnamed protein product [Rhizopus microsporus]
MKAYQNDGMAKELPDEYKKYLNKFNCQNASELRSKLSETKESERSYDRSKSFDLDWIEHSVYTLLREYGDGSFKLYDNEQWYNVLIRGLIDRCFETGEACSIVSSIKKKNRRNIRDVEEVDQDITSSAIHVQSDYFLPFKLNESYPVLPREDIDATINRNQLIES